MARGESEPDHYEILMVPEGATEAEIQAQYRRLAAVLHPDANPQRPDLAGERMRLLNEARDVLLDPARRAEYDARRQAGPAAQSARPEWGAGWEGAGTGPEPSPRERAGGVAEAGSGAAAYRQGRPLLPLTGVWGKAGYFLASRAACRVLGGRVAAWVWMLALPLLVVDVVHAAVTFFLLSWWLGESPLATYPVALAVLSRLTYLAGLWERGAGWAILAAFGAGAVGRALTLPRYVRGLRATWGRP